MPLGVAPRWAASAASARWTGQTAPEQTSLHRLQTAGPPLPPRPQRTPRCPRREATSSEEATLAESGRRARWAWRRAQRRLAPRPPQLPAHGRRRQQLRRARLALLRRVLLPRARPLGPWVAARHRRAPRRCQPSSSCPTTTSRHRPNAHGISRTSGRPRPPPLPPMPPRLPPPAACAAAARFTSARLDATPRPSSSNR